MIAGRQIEEVVRRVLVSRRQPHDQRAAQRIVVRFQDAVLGLQLDVAGEKARAPRCPHDRVERDGRIREDGVEPLGGAGRARLAGAVERKSRLRVHTHERHVDAHRDAIGDAEVEGERRHAPLGVHEHGREVVAAHEKSLDQPATKRGMGLAKQRRADPLFMAVVRELALPRGEHGLERDAQLPGGRGIRARASLRLSYRGQQQQSAKRDESPPFAALRRRFYRRPSSFRGSAESRSCRQR